MHNEADKRRRVMMVEPDVMFGDTMLALLRHRGHDVMRQFTADQAAGAIDIWREDLDIVIVDQLLGGTESDRLGLRVLQHIRNHMPPIESIRLCLMVFDAHPEIVAAAGELDAVCLQKPFSPAQLFGVVESAAHEDVPLVTGQP
jgi:CheY-like chemotaxis protein